MPWLIFHTEFQEKVPVDPGDTFWTHLELLRKCKMVAIRGEPDFENTSDENITQMKKQQKSNGLKPVKAIKPLGKHNFTWNRRNS